MLFYTLITIVSILIITCGHVGLNTVKNNCEVVDATHPKRQFWNDEESVIKNEKILAITTGIGYGILLFMIIQLLDSYLKSDNTACGSSTYVFLIMFALFLIIISSLLINQNKSTDSTCDKQISRNFNIIYGLLGFGIGVLLYSALSIFFTEKLNTLPTNGLNICKTVVKSIVLFIFTSIILLIQTSTLVINNNNCNTEKNIDYNKKTPNIVGYTIGSLSGIFILSIIILIIVNARTGILAKLCSKLKNMNNNLPKVSIADINLNKADVKNFIDNMIK